MDNNPVVSVIVTAHNSRGTIESCLRSIIKSAEYASVDTEIILVDDRSSDGTAESARILEIDNLTIIRIESYQERHLTARQVALDLGINKARGEILFLTNADAVVPQDWILRIFSIFNEKKVDAVAGMVEFRSSNGWVAGIQNTDIVFYFWLSRFLNSAGQESGIFFGNFAFRRKIYDEIGGFDSIGFSLTEDLSFSQTLHRKGYNMHFQSHPIVSIEACPDWKALLHRTYRVSVSRLSFFSLIIWAWLLTLPLLFIPAVSGSSLGLGMFGLRYLMGAGLVGQAVLRSPRRPLFRYVLIYEFLALCFGLMVLGKTLLRHKVEWGGVTYGR